MQVLRAAGRRVGAVRTKPKEESAAATKLSAARWKAAISATAGLSATGRRAAGLSTTRLCTAAGLSAARIQATAARLCATARISTTRLRATTTRV